MSDLIEKDKAIDAIKKLPNAGTRWIVSAESVFEVLMQLPSARPKGDWVSEGRIYPPTNGYHGAVCSICGTESECLTNFCGECGADMREREGE